MTLSGFQTRQENIDQQLAEAGWGTKSRAVVEEVLILVAEGDPQLQGQHGFTDYALIGGGISGLSESE